MSTIINNHYEEPVMLTGKQIEIVRLALERLAIASEGDDKTYDAIASMPPSIRPTHSFQLSNNIPSE